MPERTGSVTAAIIWMFILSIVLFWLPIAGPLIAGFVGGRKAVTVPNALLAVFLPAILIGLALFFFASLMTGVPLIGFLAGAGGVALATAHIGPLLFGAIIGALL